MEGGNAGSVSNGILRVDQFCAQLFRIFHREGQVPVAVQGKLMSALVDMVAQIRVALDTLPYQMEGGPHLMSFQHFQPARCISGEDHRQKSARSAGLFPVPGRGCPGAGVVRRDRCRGEKC